MLDPTPVAKLDEIAATSCTGMTPLGAGSVGLRGQIAVVRSNDPELERSLLEIGFIEGARVEILHEGPFGRDPIAVQLDDMRVALRRQEADSILLHQVE